MAQRANPSSSKVATDISDFNVSNLEIFGEIAYLLKSDVDNKVGRAIDMFFGVSKEERSRVYGELYPLIPFTHEYWGCAEDAFLDQKGQSSTPEQKAQAIESYLTQMIAAVKLNPRQQAQNCKAIHILFKKVADLYSSSDDKDVQNAADLFTRMPKEQREGVYKELYRLIPFAHDYPKCAKHAFYDRQGLSSTPEQKAQAIRNYLIRNIADLFNSGVAKSEEDAMGLFSMISQEQKEKVYGELYPLITFAHSYWGCAEDAFHDRNGQSSTPQQKAQAIQKYLIKTSALPAPVAATPAREPQIARQMLEPSWREEFEKYERTPAEKPQMAERIWREEFEECERSLARIAYQAAERVGRGEFEEYEEILARKPQMGERVRREEFEEREETLVEDPDQMIESRLVATEPELQKDETEYEQVQAQELFATGARTLLSQGFLSNLTNYRMGMLRVGNDYYRPVTGATQDFSQQHLASCGSDPTREILLLNPDNCPLLAAHYDNFRSRINPEMTTKEKLEMVKHYVDTEIFPPPKGGPGLVARVNGMVTDAQSTHPTATYKSDPSVKIPLMSIEDFIEAQTGVCRHHALVVAYLIDRMLKEEEPLLEGTLQHIRGNLDGIVKGAHVWVTFIPMRKPEAPAEKWHLDTLWGGLDNFAEDCPMLRKLYGPAMIDDQITRTNIAARINGQPEGIVS